MNTTGYSIHITTHVAISLEEINAILQNASTLDLIEEDARGFEAFGFVEGCRTHLLGQNGDVAEFSFTLRELQTLARTAPEPLAAKFKILLDRHDRLLVAARDAVVALD